MRFIKPGKPSPGAVLSVVVFAMAIASGHLMQTVLSEPFEARRSERETPPLPTAPAELRGRIVLDIPPPRDLPERHG